MDFYERRAPSRTTRPTCLTDLGVCYRETGNPQKALELFDRAADLHPEHWQSRYNAAVVRLFDLNDLAGAKREVEKLKRSRARSRTSPTWPGSKRRSPAGRSAPLAAAGVRRLTAGRVALGSDSALPGVGR